MSTSIRHIAVCGDAHGHLRLMFQLCRLWQLDHGVHLDGILQCGDLGFYPDLSRLDRATRNYAKRDPEELGFAEYLALPKPLKRDKLLAQTLNGDPDDLNTVRCPVIFCHGNHEDFELLAQTTSNAPLAFVDVFQRIYYLRSGEVTELAGLRIAALGGAPEVEAKELSPPLGKYVSPQAANRLQRQDFDVLLSHGSPIGIGGQSDQWGSSLIREVVHLASPAYHFYAHHAQPIAPAKIGRTSCTWFNDVNFQRGRHGRFYGQVEFGCMGVLTWRGPDDHDLAVIDEPWFRQLTANTWRHY
jgi:hypothetical protein